MSLIPSRLPFHQADFYYNGKIGKWSIDLNASLGVADERPDTESHGTSSELG